MGFCSDWAYKCATYTTKLTQRTACVWSSPGEIDESASNTKVRVASEKVTDDILHVRRVSAWTGRRGAVRLNTAIEQAVRLRLIHIMFIFIQHKVATKILINSLGFWDRGLMTRSVSERPRSWYWSYTFGLGLGLAALVLVLVFVLYFWSRFQHCCARQDAGWHDNAEM